MEYCLEIVVSLQETASVNGLLVSKIQFYLGFLKVIEIIIYERFSPFSLMWIIVCDCFNSLGCENYHNCISRNSLVNKSLDSKGATTVHIPIRLLNRNYYYYNYLGASKDVVRNERTVLICIDKSRSEEITVTVLFPSFNFSFPCCIKVIKRLHTKPTYRLSQATTEKWMGSAFTDVHRSIFSM